MAAEQPKIKVFADGVEIQPQVRSGGEFRFFDPKSKTVVLEPPENTPYIIFPNNGQPVFDNERFAGDIDFKDMPFEKRFDYILIRVEAVTV